MCSTLTGKYFFLLGKWRGAGVGAAGRQLQGQCEDTRSLLDTGSLPLT